MVSYASQKDGISVSARQPEPDFGAEFMFVTDCSSGWCVATAVDGPDPTNPSVPRPQRFTWSGTHWTFVYEWDWDCFRGVGVAREWSPARSWAVYTPQPDSLRGTWHTDIASGQSQRIPPRRGECWSSVSVLAPPARAGRT